MGQQPTMGQPTMGQHPMFSQPQMMNPMQQQQQQSVFNPQSFAPMSSTVPQHQLALYQPPNPQFPFGQPFQQVIID